MTHTPECDYFVLSHCETTLEIFNQKGNKLLPEQLQHFVVDKADDMKASDIVIIDVREKSSITDFMVLCTGNSKRHVSSIAEHVADQAQAAQISTLGMDGEKEGEWVVLDLGDVMLHIMQEEQRDMYQLEKLWN